MGCEASEALCQPRQKVMFRSFAETGKFANAAEKFS